MRESIRSNIQRLTWLQLLVACVIAIAWAFSSLRDATSALLGGLACIGPTLFFARRFFAQINKDPRDIIRSFYFGELLKMFLSIALLILIYKGLHTAILPLVSGFAGAQFGLWLAPMFGMTNVKAGQS